jgi:hypothetical protein
MSANRMLSVRLPESDVRRFKSLAASRGVSVQTAVQQAIEVWALEEPTIQLESLSALEGSLAGYDVFALRQREKRVEARKDKGR